MGGFREFIDWIFMGDKKWKKKYCPTLYKWVHMSQQEFHEEFLKMAKSIETSRKVCPNCNGIYFFDKCPECTKHQSCGAYVLRGE
jgi:hypothetical protein